MNFEWDNNKNEINQRKHNISFEEASNCWEDDNSFDIFDEKHSSIDEKRWLKFGRLENGKVLCVVYTMFDKNYRLISAFTDKKIERFYYEQNFGR
jgi:uncharacterized DUF497 family protein